MFALNFNPQNPYCTGEFMILQLTFPRGLFRSGLHVFISSKMFNVIPQQSQS